MTYNVCNPHLCYLIYELRKNITGNVLVLVFAFYLSPCMYLISRNKVISYVDYVVINRLYTEQDTRSNHNTHEMLSYVHRSTKMYHTAKVH